MQVRAWFSVQKMNGHCAEDLSTRCKDILTKLQHTPVSVPQRQRDMGITTKLTNTNVVVIAHTHTQTWAEKNGRVRACFVGGVCFKADFLILREGPSPNNPLQMQAASLVGSRQPQRVHQGNTGPNKILKPTPSADMTHESQEACTLYHEITLEN